MSLINLMRVPPMLILDIILFKGSFVFLDLSDQIFLEKNEFLKCIFDQLEINESALYYKTIFISFIKVMFCLILCLSLYSFFLPAKHLYLMYIHVVSVCIVLLSNWANIQTLKVVYGKCENFEINAFHKDITWDVDGFLYIFTELQSTHLFYPLFNNLIIQCILSLVFKNLQVSTRNHSIHKVFSFSFTIPTLIGILHITRGHGILNIILALFSTILPWCIIKKTFFLNLFSVSNLFYYRYMRPNINNYEMLARINMDLNSLNILSVLRIFWAIRVLAQILHLLIDMETQNETLFGIVKYLVAQGCDTIPAILGMSSFVSYFCNYIYVFFQRFMLTDEVDNNDKNIEKDSAVLFFVLVISKGVTGFNSENCFITLCKTIGLLCVFLLHHIHENVDQLLSLCTSNALSFKRHLRALLVSGFLILFPITMLTYLWSHHSNYWLISVSASGIEYIIKTLISIVVYLLLLIDNYYQTNWENLDDYVNIIKSLGNLVGLFLRLFSLNIGVLDIALSPDSTVYSLVILFIPMCVHGYENIFCVAWDEWMTTTDRQLAAKEIALLLDATKDQLSELDDVCAICLQNMRSAKITKCNHYFHGACLYKLLLYTDFQVQCPLCQNNIISYTET